MGLVFLAIINELDLFLLPSDRKFKFYVLIKNITFVIIILMQTQKTTAKQQQQQAMCKTSGQMPIRLEATPLSLDAKYMLLI